MNEFYNEDSLRRKVFEYELKVDVFSNRLIPVSFPDISGRISGEVYFFPQDCTDTTFKCNVQVKSKNSIILGA